MRENISGIRVIKALSKTDYEKERFASVNQEVVRREKKAGITMALTNPMMNLFLNGGPHPGDCGGCLPCERRRQLRGQHHRLLELLHHHLERHDGRHPYFRHVLQGCLLSGARIQEVLETPKDLHVTPEEPVEIPLPCVV